MGPTHQVILVKGPGDDQWRLVDAAFGGNTPSHLIPLQAPVNDAFHGAFPGLPCTSEVWQGCGAAGRQVAPIVLQVTCSG